MNTSLRRWFDTIPLTDPVERREASVFQFFLLGWLVLASIGVPLLAVSGAQAPNPSPELQLSGSLLALASTLLWLSPAIALVVLRRGHFERSVAIAAVGPLISQAVAMVLLGVVPSALILFFVPITFAGLLAGRRLLLIVAGLSVLTVVVVAILESLTPPMAGFFTRALNSATGLADTGSAAVTQGILLGFFFVVVALLTLLFDRFGSTLRDAFVTSLEREAELSSIRASLETIVAERTAALQSALDDVEARAEEQEHLLREIELQRETIKDLNVPVIPISATTLVMPLVGALDSTRLRQLQEQSLQALERTSARVLILDITGVPVVDSHVAQGLLMTVRSARLLGAEVTLVGIRPEVAQTIVGLGIELSDVRTFSDLHSALDQISAAQKPMTAAISRSAA
jgi:rsbT co-antagonist protein RsbR